MRPRHLLRGSAHTPNNFGASLATRGNRLLVGASSRSFNEKQPPAAFLFESKAGDWNLVSRFEAPVPDLAEGFGLAVALDAQTVVVGSPGYENGDGELAVFNHDGSLQRQIDSPHRDVELFDWYGTALALHGSTIIVGASLHGGRNEGLVYVFDREGNVQTLNGPADRRDFGEAIALDADVMVVGARSFCLVFRHDGRSWREHARLESKHSGDHFGSSVAISGSVFAVGAPFGDAARIELYRLTHDGCNLVGTLEGDPDFGCAVALNGDRLAVGESCFERSDKQTGRVGLYRLSPGAVQFREWIELDAPKEFARLGSSLAFGPDFLAAGAPGRTDDKGTGEVLIISSDW